MHLKTIDYHIYHSLLSLKPTANLETRAQRTSCRFGLRISSIVYIYSIYIYIHMTCIYTVMILNDPSMSQLHRQDAAPGSSPSVVLSDVSGTWVRRLQKYFWGQRVYKNQPVQAKPTNKALGPIGDTESPWKHIEKNHGKTKLLEAVFSHSISFIKIALLCIFGGPVRT